MCSSGRPLRTQVDDLAGSVESTLYARSMDTGPGTLIAERSSEECTLTAEVIKVSLTPAGYPN